MDVLEPEQALDWVSAQEVRDPYWADTEMTLRRTAMQIQAQLVESGNFSVNVPVIGPSKTGFGSFKTIHIVARGYRLGGVEELLMIEEQLRRALREVKTVQEQI